MRASTKIDKVVVDGATSTWDRYEWTWIETLKDLMTVINLTSKSPPQSWKEKKGSCSEAKNFDKRLVVVD